MVRLTGTEASRGVGSTDQRDALDQTRVGAAPLHLRGGERTEQSDRTLPGAWSRDSEVIEE